MQKRCPYTLKQLTDLPEVSLEHVFPDALGGGSDYSVKACAKVNSDLGTKVDAPLAECFLVSLSRVSNGLRSRSGDHHLKLKGKQKGSGRDVEVSLKADGTLDARFPKTVVMNEDGTRGTLTLAPEQAERFLKQFIEKKSARGCRVEVAKQESVPVGTLELDTIVDFRVLARGLLKIAYLVAFECLGDRFLDDPLIPRWHEAFVPPTGGQTAFPEPPGFVIGPTLQNILRVILPPAQEYEHVAATLNLGNLGTVVVVRLFGSDLLSALTKVSETDRFGMAEGDGKVVICDVQKKRSQTISFLDHFQLNSAGIQEAMRMAPNPGTPGGATT